MIQNIKIALYFTIARYFRFFAAIRLKRWKPRVVIITGSNGKTTALHLTAVQLGSAAKYSFHANSAFGIPFDILGLKRSTFSPWEWPWLFLSAPFHALKGPHPEKIYVVEADGDRPSARTPLRIFCSMTSRGSSALRWNWLRRSDDARS